MKILTNRILLLLLCLTLYGLRLYPSTVDLLFYITFYIFSGKSVYCIVCEYNKNVYCVYTCTHTDMNKLLISKWICPYLAAAASSERLTRFGGSRARLVRTPQAEKHISVLFESSSVTTNWCTDREKVDRGVIEWTRTKRGKDKRTAIDGGSRHVYADCSRPCR